MTLGGAGGGGGGGMRSPGLPVTSWTVEEDEQDRCAKLIGYLCRCFNVGNVRKWRCLKIISATSTVLIVAVLFFGHECFPQPCQAGSGCGCVTAAILDEAGIYSGRSRRTARPQNSSQFKMRSWLSSVKLHLRITALAAVFLANSL